MSIFGIVCCLYFVLLSAVLFVCVVLPLPIGACIDACKDDLVQHLQGPGNRMITDLSACSLRVIFMCLGFLCLTSPLLLGRDSPWHYQLVIALYAITSRAHGRGRRSTTRVGTSD